MRVTKSLKSMETKYCEEFTGLFVIRKCENPPTTICDKCSKNICSTHAFKANETNFTKLCISCFVEFDARLTNVIELYSKDRAIWRRKMIQRFHDEYPYMVFMAENYGSLFETTSGTFIHDTSDEGSYFDS